MLPTIRRFISSIPKQIRSRPREAAILAFMSAGAAAEYKFRLLDKLKRVTETPKSALSVKSDAPSVEDMKALLPYLSDEVFETTDDMLVFTFPSEEQLLKQISKLKSVKAAVNSSDFPRVKMFFVILPARDPGAVIGDNLEVMCYKGQRKQRSSIPLDKEAPIEEWKEFFKFKSTPVDEELKECSIEHISGSDFNSKVLQSEQPILLQLYEKSCFLCFLMRPFLNSLYSILKESGEVDFAMKRLDIEENDFPEGLPVVRGTPTFILYQKGVGKRLEEFKPRDLVNGLCRDYPLSESTREKLNGLVDKMTLRFQAFSGLVMWSTESEKILNLLSQKTVSENSDEKDKDMFNKLVAEYMAEDMLKVDSLPDNIQNIMRDLSSAERNAIMMGQVLGEKVVHLEKDQV